MVCLRKSVREDIGLKDSYFDGFEYKGYKVKTKLVIEGHKEYKPIKLSKSGDVYEAFKKFIINQPVVGGTTQQEWPTYQKSLLDAVDGVMRTDEE